MTSRIRLLGALAVAGACLLGVPAAEAARHAPARAAVRSAATSTMTALAGVPAGMPSDVPAAATAPDPVYPEPSATEWPFPNAFPQTSGTGRLDGGAELWTDFIYDDYGASGTEGVNTSPFALSSALAPRQGDYSFPAGSADNNGADIFRAGIGVKGGYSYWRVDWVTLADPSVPIAEWTFDTDNDPATGVSAWPAQAGVSSPGIDKALVVSSRGAWLIDPMTGARTSVTADGGTLIVDPTAKSFIVKIPTALLPVSGSWRIRLAAGLADATGENFAEPYVAGSQSATAERVYNITFRTVAQEPPVYTDGSTDAQIAAAQALLAGTPLGTELGLDGIARTITGNFWMEDDQANTLATGDVSKFSLLLNWAQLSAGTTTPPLQPTGYSARWYVSRFTDLGHGQVDNDGGTGNFEPTLLEPIQPYAVYVPTTYKPGTPTPLTWILHSLEVNYNQYGGYDPDLMQQLCQDRGSICATTEGFGPAGWYYNQAETDFWQVWRQLAEAFTLNPDRTVISGYSMGGWASYKLAFEHPDDFAGALVLDGPLVCGIEVVPGVDAGTSSDPGCAGDGQSEPLIANAKWIPYVIDQTYADELVPTTGVLSQVHAFDTLGQRYDLFIHTGGDHLAFATEDRFDDAVTALGNPVRVTDPGSFTFDWYPSLNNAADGIGATGDYWVSAVSARNIAYGTIASIKANDDALPEPAITPVRSGTSLVTQPIPGTNTKLTWTLGATPAPRRAMALTLTDVAGLTVNTTMAKLPSGSLTVDTDGPTTVTLADLAAGTQVLKGSTHLATVGRTGEARVALAAGTSVLTLDAPVFSCARPTGRLTSDAVGPLGLGITRAAARALFPQTTTAGHGYMDFFCRHDGGVRVGYASQKLLSGLPARSRSRYAGRTVLVLTANRHYALRGVRPGTRLTASLARRLQIGPGYVVGANTWYLLANGSGRGVFKVRHEEIDEVGVADASLTASRRAVRRFLTSFS